MDLAELAIKVDTSDLRKGEAALTELERRGRTTERSVRRVGGTVQGAGRNMAGFQHAVANASFQVGDFATQVAGGTAASRALAQQLPQLVGGLGPVGAVMSAVVAIGVPLGAMLYNAATGADEAAEAAERYTDALEALEAVSQRLNDDLLMIEYGALTAAEARARNEMEEIGRELDKHISKWRDMGTLQRALNADLEHEIGLLNDRYDEARNELLIIEQRREALEEARREQEAITASMRASTQVAQTVRNSTDAYVSKMAEGFRNAQEMREKLGDAAYEAARLAGIDMASGISDAAAEAATLAARLGVSLSTAISIKNLQDSMQYGGRGNAMGEWRARQNPNSGGKNGTTAGYSPPDLSSMFGSGGGGGGGGESFADRLERLQEELRTEAEVIDANYFERLEILEDRRAKEILGEQGHKEALLDLERDYLEQVRELNRKEQAAKLDGISGAFGDVASLMQSENKKLFAIGKAAAIAEATVSGYKAAVEAWEKGMAIGGPPVAAAFTAASLARTGSLIASIASQSIGGGGGGSPGVSSSAAGSEAASQAGTYYNVTLAGGDAATFTGTQVRNLIEKINDEIRNGAELKGIRVR